MTETIRDHWDQRAAQGETAGTRDLIAVELEQRAIGKHIRDGMRILDVGCGTGATALRLAREHRIEIVGIDYAPAMVHVARTNLESNRPEHSSVYFECGNVLTVEWARPFDLIYTQRCLINLPDWLTQRAAIEHIISWLKPDGLYLSVECCQDGLDGINELRATVGLPAIIPPWHNHYLRYLDLDGLANDLAKRGIARWINTDNYSGCYYVLSRVINAALAQREGREPDYDSPINRLALELPADTVSLWGQGLMFVWQRSNHNE